MKILVLTTTLVAISAATHAAASWEQTNGPQGSELQAAVVSENGDILVAGSSGGVYRSTDLGQTWVPTALTVDGLDALAVAPNGDLFAGAQGGDIYRSTNHGETWIQVAAFDVRINTILIPVDGIVLVGGWLTDVVPAPAFLLARSTDNGNTWTQHKSETGLGGYSLHDLALAPDGKIYAATGNEFGGLGGIYVSDDNGATWIVTATPNATWECVAANDDALLGGVTYGESPGVYRSTDGGATWTLSNSGLEVAFAQSLSVGPDQTLYASAWGLYRSLDDGLTWVPTNLTFTSNGKLAFHPDGAIVAPTHRWGAFLSADGGESWAESNAGLIKTTLRKLIVTGSGAVAGAASYRAYQTTNRGNDWSVSLSPGILTEWLVDANGTLFMGGQGNAGIWRSVDDGATWSMTNFTGGSFSAAVLANGDLLVNHGGVLEKSSDGFATWTTLPSPESGGHFMQSMAVSAGGAVFGLSAGSGLYRSLDDGASWTVVTGSWHPGSLRLVATHPEGAIYVSTRDNLFRSSDVGDTWMPTDLGRGNVDFDVDPLGRIFVVSGSDVFHSMGGLQWQQLVGDLPAGITTLAIGPDGQAYVGVKGNGVFRSQTLTTSTPPSERATFVLEQNVPNPFNPRTTIRAVLPQESDYTLSIFDVRGRLVRCYRDHTGPGVVSVTWDGRAASGAPVSSGTYVYRIRVGSVEDSKKMVFLQ